MFVLFFFVSLFVYVCCNKWPLEAARPAAARAPESIHFREPRNVLNNVIVMKLVHGCQSFSLWKLCERVETPS